MKIRKVSYCNFNSKKLKSYAQFYTANIITQMIHNLRKEDAKLSVLIAMKKFSKDVTVSIKNYFVITLLFVVIIYRYCKLYS